MTVILDHGDWDGPIEDVESHVASVGIEGILPELGNRRRRIRNLLAAEVIDSPSLGLKGDAGDPTSSASLGMCASSTQASGSSTM